MNFPAILCFSRHGGSPVGRILFLWTFALAAAGASAGGLAEAARIFYRARDWLQTSPAIQMRLVAETTRAWGAIADDAEQKTAAGEALSVREREAVRAMECISLSPGLTAEEIRRAIDAYVTRHPDRVYGNFGDLAWRALDSLCPQSP